MKLAMIIKDENPGQSGIRNVRLLKNRSAGCSGYRMLLHDQELLKKIRENAYGYFHGHEVGGTKPSLLEALGATNLNLLLDVRFNREGKSRQSTGARKIEIWLD